MQAASADPFIRHGRGRHDAQFSPHRSDLVANPIRPAMTAAAFTAPHAAARAAGLDQGSLAEMTPRNYRAYPKIKSALESHAEAGLAKLYEAIAANPKTAALLPTADLRAGAARAQSRHWQALFSGPFDAAAEERSAHIGRVHATIGLTPSYYISGYAIMLEEVITSILSHGVRGRLMGGGQANVVATLVKTALLDMQSALSAYFLADEQARTSAIAALGNALSLVAQGDLRSELKGMPKSFEQISQDFHDMRFQVSQMVRQMADELGGWFPKHAQAMDGALAQHLRNVGYDPVTGQISVPQALPAATLHGCGGASNCATDEEATQAKAVAS